MVGSGKSNRMVSIVIILTVPTVPIPLCHRNSDVAKSLFVRVVFPRMVSSGKSNRMVSIVIILTFQNHCSLGVSSHEWFALAITIIPELPRLALPGVSSHEWFASSNVVHGSTGVSFPSLALNTKFNKSPTVNTRPSSVIPIRLPHMFQCVESCWQSVMSGRGCSYQGLSSHQNSRTLAERVEVSDPYPCNAVH